MEHLQAIIFDVDGTLADTENIHRTAFNNAFREHGLDWQWSKKEYARLLSISGGFERMKFYSNELTDESHMKFSEKLIKTIHKTKNDIYAQLLLNSNIELRPGISRLIFEARKEKLLLAIATNTNKKNVEILLDKNLPKGWKNWFSAVATSDTVVEKKPSAAVYLAVLKTTNLNASHVIALEDTENGLLAATAAGISTIITTHEFTHHCDFPEAALVVDSAGDASRPFNVLNGRTIDERWLTISLLDKLLGQK